nr:hypothetical protein HK105_007134 [Polyrhizophydium stewartii]
MMSQRGDLQGLIDALQSTPREELSITDFNLVLEACVKAADTSAFDAVWSMLAEFGASVRPKLTTHNLRMRHRFAKDGLDAGLACFGEMRAAGLTPTILEYNILLEHLFLAGRSDQAMTVFDQLRRSDTPPNAFTYSIMIRRCAQSHMVLHTFKYYYALLDSSIPFTATLWGTLVGAFVAIADMPTAEQCLADMIRDGEHDPTEIIFAHLMRGYLAQGDFGKVFEHFVAASEWGLDASLALQSIFGQAQLASRQTPDDAFRDYRRVAERALKQFEISPNPPIHLAGFLCSLVRHFAKLRQPAMCETLLADMQGFGLSVNVARAYMIEAYALTGQMDAATAILDDFRNQGIPLTAFVCNCMIIGALRKQMRQLADSILEEMVSQGLSLRPIVLNAFLRHDISNGVGISQTLESLGKLGIPFNQRTIWFIIFHYGVRANQFGDAWKSWTNFLDSIGHSDQAAAEPEPINMRLSRLVLHICARHGRHDLIGEVAAVCRRGQPEEALQQLEQAVQDAYAYAQPQVAPAIAARRDARTGASGRESSPNAARPQPSPV